MKVRYLVSEASVAWSRMPGVVYDLPEAEAVAALNAGKAEPFEEEASAVEAATRSSRETAVKSRTRGR